MIALHIALMLAPLVVDAGATRAPTVATARDTIRVYGPGGPLPAIKDAAAQFQRAHNIVVIVTGGPTPQWLERAKRDADIIYSGSEHMMTDFLAALPMIDHSTIDPLYLRPAALLVRPGNPRRIHGLRDVLAPGTRILVVHGSGQTGLWEDVAGRTGNIETLRAFRRNIAHFAPNSGEARKIWMTDASIDAWLIYTHWQVANAELADRVALEPEYTIYRPADVALTQRGARRQSAVRFVEFLKSAEGAAIFRRWGWIT